MPTLALRSSPFPTQANLPTRKSAVWRSRLWAQADERIAAKHRDFHHAPPVVPPVNLVEKGKERADTLLFKLRSNSLFVPRHGVNRVQV
jgi:hypothetical protein